MLELSSLGELKGHHQFKQGTGYSPLSPNPPKRCGLGVGTRGAGTLECDGRGSIPIDGAGGGLELSSSAGFTVLLRQWFRVTNAYWAQALFTLYGAPDCRRRYAEGPGAAPLADSAGYHLDDRGSCSSDNRRGAPSFLPSAFAFSKPALVRRRMDTSSWSDTQAAKPARV